MSFLSFFGKSKFPIFMVVDVGTHAIRAITFEMPHWGDKPRIIKKSFLRMPGSVHSGDEGKEHHSLRISTKLRELLFAVLKELGRIPEKIWIGMGPHVAPYSLETWKGTYHAKGKIVTKNDLYEYFEELSKSYRDEETYVMAFPVEAFLNRYPVNLRDFTEITLPEVSGKVIKECDIEFRTIVIRFPKEIGHSFVEIKESLGGMPIEFVPIAAVILDIVPEVLKLKDVFLIDIGGEETSLMLMRNGTLLQLVFFPMGVSRFVKGIARFTGASLDEAEDAQRQYIEDMTNPERKQKLQEFLMKESEEWKKKFLDTRDLFYHIGLLPVDVVLFGGGAAVPEIKAILRDPEWMKGFSYVAEPRVRLFDPTAIFKGDSLGGVLQGPQDVGLGALAYYAIKEMNEISHKR